MTRIAGESSSGGSISSSSCPSLEHGRTSSSCSFRPSIGDDRFGNARRPSRNFAIARKTRRRSRTTSTSASVSWNSAASTRRSVRSKTLKREPNHSPACFNLARCFYETDKAAVALAIVQRIIDKEPRWEDYAAWRLLVQIHEDMNEDQAALDAARQLVKLSPRIQHKVLLANQLVRQNQDGEARLVLENALQEQQFVNGPVRRLNRKWVKEAKKLLGDLSPR